MKFETVMKLFSYPKLALLALASIIALHTERLPASTIELTPIERIAFGSCADQQESLAIFDTITQENPDIFVFWETTFMRKMSQMTRYFVAHRSV